MPDELSAPEEKQRRGPRSNQKLLYTHGMGTWKSKNRHKYLLQYHIIFVCKYRKKLLVSRQISDDIKQFSYEKRYIENQG